MKRLAATLMLAAILAPTIAVGQDFGGRGGGERGPGGGERHQRERYDGPGRGRGPYREDGRGPDRDGGPGLARSFPGAPERFRSGGFDTSPYRDREPPPRRAYYPPIQGGDRGWNPGQILPRAYQGDVISDYGLYHLRRPPRGYFWCRNGDDFVLAARATGLIFEVISADGY